MASPSHRTRKRSDLFVSQAVIKEAMRLAPTNNLPLERIVPREGLNISGYKIPAGTNVGTSAYVIHRDQSVYGSDANQFRPERWLESDDSMLRQMQNHFFAVYCYPHRASEFFCNANTNGVPVRPRRAWLQWPYTSNDDDGEICRSNPPIIRHRVGQREGIMGSQGMVDARAAWPNG